MNNLNWFQSLVVAACGVILWALVAQLNHYIAPWHLNVFAGGLLVAYPALCLSSRDHWRIVLVLGLWCDAAAPVPFGLHTALFLITGAIIHKFRGRLARSDTVLRMLIALGANTGLCIALAFALALRAPAPHGAAWTLVINLALSNALVALVAPWYFALQDRSLLLTGAMRHASAASSARTKK